MSIKSAIAVVIASFVGCCAGLIIHSLKDKPCPKQPVIHKHVVKRYNLPAREVWLRQQYEKRCDEKNLYKADVAICNHLIDTIGKERD